MSENESCAQRTDQPDYIQVWTNPRLFDLICRHADAATLKNIMLLDRGSFKAGARKLHGRVGAYEKMKDLSNNTPSPLMHKERYMTYTTAADTIIAPRPTNALNLTPYFVSFPRLRRLIVDGETNGGGLGKIFIECDRNVDGHWQRRNAVIHVRAPDEILHAEDRLFHESNVVTIAWQDLAPTITPHVDPTSAIAAAAVATSVGTTATAIASSDPAAPADPDAWQANFNPLDFESDSEDEEEHEDVVVFPPPRTFPFAETIAKAKALLPPDWQSEIALYNVTIRDIYQARKLRDLLCDWLKVRISQLTIRANELDQWPWHDPVDWLRIVTPYIYKSTNHGGFDPTDCSIGSLEIKTIYSHGFPLDVEERKRLRESFQDLSKDLIQYAASSTSFGDNIHFSPIDRPPLQHEPRQNEMTIRDAMSTMCELAPTLRLCGKITLAVRHHMTAEYREREVFRGLEDRFLAFFKNDVANMTRNDFKHNVELELQIRMSDEHTVETPSPWRHFHDRLMRYLSDYGPFSELIYAVWKVIGDWGTVRIQFSMDDALWANDDGQFFTSRSDKARQDFLREESKSMTEMLRSCIKRWRNGCGEWDDEIRGWHQLSPLGVLLKSLSLQRHEPLVGGVFVDQQQS